MSLSKDQQVDSSTQTPIPAFVTRPETDAASTVDTSFGSPARERNGLLPPANGQPPVARAADFMNASTAIPDMTARAQMSIAMQQSVGNARMGEMLKTVPEPKAPPPAPVQPPPVIAQPAPVVVLPALVTPPTAVTTMARATLPAPATTEDAEAPITTVSESPTTESATPQATSPTQSASAQKPGAKAKGTKAKEESPTSADAAEPTGTLPSETAGAAAPLSTRAGKAGADQKGTVAGAESEEGEAEGKGEGGKAVVELKMPEPPTDVSPATRQRIKKVKTNAGRSAAAHTDLPTAHDSTVEAHEAVTEPKEEADAHAEEKLVVALGVRPKPSPVIEKLCADIYRVIRSKRPADEDSLVEAKPEEMAKDAGELMKGNVEGDVKSVDQNYDALDKSPTAPQQQGAPLESPPADANAPDINAKQATPDAVPAQNVSLDSDVDANKARMSEAGMESEPAKLAQTGPVAEARDAQGELEQVAAEDPAKVLAEQKAALSKANADMGSLQQKALNALANSRRTTVSGTTGQQKQMVGTEAEMRIAASREAKGYFTSAQTAVDGLLRDLNKTALSKWDVGVNAATLQFKQSLKTVADWIDERHSGGFGTLVSIGDYFTGLPGWVTEAYDAAEKKFGDDVCKLALDISTEVNGVIMACEALIADANVKIAGVFARLPKSMQDWAATEQAQLGAQLATLNKKAHNARDNFDRELSNRARQSVQDVRGQIQELRQKAKGLVGRIADAVNRFLDDPVKFIIEALLDLLSIPRAAFWAVVAKIKKVIGDIADDPEKFANNLMDAVGKGFSQFFDNIGDHLIKGFLDWITGGLAGAGVNIPKDFSLKSMMTFFLELMGITWPRIRKLLAKHIGEENIALLEKAYSIVANLVALGPEGVFEMIEKQLDPQAILDKIIKAAVDYMMSAIVKAVAARILLLFNPVGAILQAIEGIYKVLKWIFQNAARIFRLIETIVNGIADIIAGNIGGMANAIEKALAGLIPPVIAFLADYLGFGDLPNKVKDTIISFQDWIEGILDRVIAWLIEKGKALLKAVGLGGEEKNEEDKEPVDGQIGKVVSWTAAGEPHKLWIVKEGSGASVMMSSDEKPVAAQLDEYQSMAETQPPDKKDQAIALISQARQLVAGVDSTADQLASAASDPEKSAEGATEKEASVESGEDQLASVLAQIRELLGLASNELKLEEAFSMSTEGHHLYVKAKRPEKPRIEMATARRDYLDAIVQRAIKREEAGAKRPNLLGPLREIAKELDNINWDWEANQGKSAEEEEARVAYVQALARVAIVLNSIGVEFGLTDLANLGHPSKYAEVEAIGGFPKLKPDSRGGSNIRGKFYGGYRTTTYDWKDKRLAKLTVGAPPGHYFDEMTNKAEPIDLPNLPTNVTIDHVSPKVVEHWNDKGHDCVQGDRLDFFNETGNMRLVTWKNNSTDGAKTLENYQDEVGISFRGPKDNP